MRAAPRWPASTDRVVLTTGGTSGMGLATARLLLENGAHVIITGRDDVRLTRAAEQLNVSSDGVAGLLTRRADSADPDRPGRPP